jgi:hypothetical protein
VAARTPPEHLLGGTTSSATTITLQFSSSPGSMTQSDALQLSGVPTLSGGQPEETDAWVNAVEGNFGGDAVFIGDRAFDPLTDFQLGTWGIDTTTSTMSAVLDHRSAFAVVPEPGVAGLLAMGETPTSVRFAGARRRPHIPNPP